MKRIKIGLLSVLFLVFLTNSLMSETTENKTGRIDILSKTHFFYQSHDPYVCDLEITKTPINN